MEVDGHPISRSVHLTVSLGQVDFMHAQLVGALRFVNGLGVLNLDLPEGISVRLPAEAYLQVLDKDLHEEIAEFVRGGTE
jgi:hypothetical protein